MKVQANQTLDIAQPDLTPRLPPQAVTPQVSTGKLSNGIQVASWENFGPASSLTFSLNASSRFESAENRGVSHFLRLFGFRVLCQLSFFVISFFDFGRMFCGLLASYGWIQGSSVGIFVLG